MAERATDADAPGQILGWEAGREQRRQASQFQGLPVISDCTGRAHPLGRGFAHLTAEPAPLGHRQRVDHVHGAAGGVVSRTVAGLDHTDIT